MTNTRIWITVAILLIAVIIGGALGRSVTRVSTGLSAPIIPEVSARASTPGDQAPRLLFSGTVETRSPDALHAKQQLQDRINSISRFAARHGGRVTLGEIRYLRPEGALQNPPLPKAGIWIIQRLDIELPDLANQERLRAELARMSFVPHG